MIAIAATAVGCGGAAEPNSSTGAKTETVVVTPSTSSVSVGAVVPLQAKVLDASGNVVSGVTIYWSSSDTNVVTVSSLGLVSAKALGTAQVAASAEGKSAVVTLTVVPIPVASVVVLPQNGTIVAGDKIDLQAVTYDANKATLTSRVVTWATSAPGTATVDASGNVTGVAAGTATITATSEGKSGSATIVVTAAPPVVVPVASVEVSPQTGNVTVGRTIALRATTRDTNGATLTGRTVTWSSSDTGTATVNDSGTVTGVAPGTVTITATSEGQSGSATIVVAPRKH